MATDSKLFLHKSGLLHLLKKQLDYSPDNVDWIQYMCNDNENVRVHLKNDILIHRSGKQNDYSLLVIMPLIRYDTILQGDRVMRYDKSTYAFDDLYLVFTKRDIQVISRAKGYVNAMESSDIEVAVEKEFGEYHNLITEIKFKKRDNEEFHKINFIGDFAVFHIMDHTKEGLTLDNFDYKQIINIPYQEF